MTWTLTKGGQQLSKKKNYLLLLCPNTPIVGLLLSPLLVSNPLLSSTTKSKLAFLVPLASVTVYAINVSFTPKSLSWSKYTCVVIMG
jgi:hypothetical protein